MCSIQEYTRKLPRETVEQLLRDYCDGADQDPITVLAICDALTKYNPDLPDPYEALRHLCRQYLP